MKLLVTGGAGFIGSNFIRYWLKNHPEDIVVNFDKLTYAGHPESLRDIEENSRYSFVQGDICDEQAVDNVMQNMDIVVHFAAESHVDRSVIDPFVFIKTNVLGTGILLESAKKHKTARFHHVSTDEVFGQLSPGDAPFDEHTPLAPRTPYASSKAASDMLVNSYFVTYGLPITISNCSNNYGPYQDPEKLIPRFTTNLLEGKKVPLMGKGENVRDWLHVEDHCRAIDVILEKGVIGERYCIGGSEEHSNLEITKQILHKLGKDESMIEFVEHRLGHDLRYAIDSSRLKALGWNERFSFADGLEQTVQWYKDNEWWWKPLKVGRPIVDRIAQKGY